MPQLTITYDGRTIYDADVQTFGYETNAKGELFVSAGTQPVEQDAVEGKTGDDVDDRLTPFEKSLLQNKPRGAADAQV
jgi:hypothetical protein